MTTAAEITEYINSLAPFETMEEWDNCGLLVGDPQAQVSCAAVSLDITAESVNAAKALGAQLIISHHPVIFKAQKSFLSGSVPYELAAAGLTAVCCHTPLDAAEGGVNDVLCEKLGFDSFSSPEEEPLLRVANIDETDASALAALVGKKLGAAVRLVDAGKKIRRVAVCGGSGCSFLMSVPGIDAFVTGDASYHDFLDARQAGITLIAAGHFETENPVIPVLTKKLSEKFGDVKFTAVCSESPIKNVY